MLVLPVGTKELLEVDVTDLLTTLTTLNGSGLVYTVKNVKTGTAMYSNATGQNEGMKALLMIDTTTGGGWPKAKYELFIKFNALPEVPVLGPYEFLVDRGP